MRGATTDELMINLGIDTGQGTFSGRHHLGSLSRANSVNRTFTRLSPDCTRARASMQAHTNTSAAKVAPACAAIGRLQKETLDARTVLLRQLRTVPIDHVEGDAGREVQMNGDPHGDVSRLMRTIRFMEDDVISNTNSTSSSITASSCLT